MSGKGLFILLVEDNPGDAGLVEEALRASGNGSRLQVCRDGEEAMAFLRESGREGRPDLVLLDLEMPRMTGREVLAAMRADEELASMPVVVFSSSAAARDVEASYRLAANSHVAKPIDLDDYLGVVRSIEEYWLTVAQLPGRT